MTVSSIKSGFYLYSKCIFSMSTFMSSSRPRASLQRLGPIILQARAFSYCSNTYGSSVAIFIPFRPYSLNLVGSTSCHCKQPYLSHSAVLFKSSPSFSTENKEPVKKPSLLQRFKEMYRDYWYVLVPVHAVTSLAWFGGFYYLLKSGVDVVGILESFEISESILRPLRDSSAGYLAISYAMYKIFTPLRYTVTLGGTTISINYLKKWGYIRPIPPREKLREMYEEQRDNLKERRASIMETDLARRDDYEK